MKQPVDKSREESPELFGEKPLPAWLVIVGVALPCIGLVALATKGFKEYGDGLFVLVPVVAGMVTAFLYNRGRVWNWGKTFWMCVLNMMLVAWGIAGFRIEGLYCILLASPLVIVAFLLGVLIAWFIRRRKNNQRTMLLLITALAPLTMGFEYAVKRVPPIREQTSVCVINAPPDVVWRFVPAFPEINAPPHGLLARGIAYPICSRMEGQGIGARRYCVLSTGAMPERVTVWEPGKRLEFDVLKTPPTMSETNPFGTVEAAHTVDYFRVLSGRFVLTALADGRTQVEGTSRFQQDIWPQFYWSPFATRIVGEVHERVFEHIKELAEKAAHS